MSSPTRVLSRSSIFASRSFRVYFAGQAASYVGDGLRTLAVPLLVFRLTGSALSTGVALICEILPFALFSLVGGSLADRVDRRALMIGSDGVRAAVLAVFAIAFAMHALTLPMLYGGLVVVSACAAVFLGGQSSSIPYLLTKDRATEAQSALMAAESTSSLVTPIAGGAIFSAFGPLPALVVNACTYAVSQVSIAFVPSLGPEETTGLPNLREIGHDVALGFRDLFADATMRAQTFASLALNVFGFGAFAIAVPFLKTQFGASDRDVGLFLGITAVGWLAGSLLAGRLNTLWPFGRMLCIALALDAVLFIPVVLTTNLWVAAAFWSLGNMCAAFEVAQIIGWRLRVTPEGRVGRVFGAVRLLVHCGIPPGIILLGYVADHANARVAMGLAAGGYAITALLAILSPAIRNETR